MSAKKRVSESPSRLPWIVASIAGVGVIAFLAGAGLGRSDTPKPPPPPDRPVAEAQPPEQPDGDGTGIRDPQADRRREPRAERRRGRPEPIQPDKQGPRHGGRKDNPGGKRPEKQDRPPERQTEPAAAMVDGRIG